MAIPQLKRKFGVGAAGMLGLAICACSGEPGGQGSDVGPVLPGSELSVRTGLAGRLTRDQHAHIVQDVLGVQLTEKERSADGFAVPEEKNSTGLFQNAADGQPAGDDYPLAFGRLAAAVAGRVDLAGLGLDAAPCAGEVACRIHWIADLGQRLFRRPLSEREQAAFASLHASVVAEGLGDEQAKRSVLEAMLQAPPFVFRLERENAAAIGEKRYLDGFELASRLSFFLWDSAPDAQLRALAESNTLDGSPRSIMVLREQVLRMLDDPRAHRMTHAFIRDFAETERASFAGITPELRAALSESMVASFESHLWQDRGQIKTLFTSTQMALAPSVAALIGITPRSDAIESYAVSALPERVGWLTHPGFIAGFGDADVGKIVHRGISLMVKLMCRQPIRIPDGAIAVAGSFNQAFANLNERQRSEQRRLMAKPVAEGGSNNPSCWACHSQFEPLAYGFNRFDAAGRYLGEVDATGAPLPTDGWMTDDLTLDESARAPYATMHEFMALMADSETIQACMAQHFLSFATGRAATAIEHEFSKSVHVEQEKNGGTLHAMVEAIASSELFRSTATAQNLLDTGLQPQAPMGGP